MKIRNGFVSNSSSSSFVVENPSHRHIPMSDDQQKIQDLNKKLEDIFYMMKRSIDREIRETTDDWKEQAQLKIKSYNDVLDRYKEYMPLEIINRIKEDIKGEERFIYHIESDEEDMRILSED